MKRANIATLRSQLSAMLAYVQKGRELQIEKRNIPIAKIVPVYSSLPNRTRLGLGKGSVKFLKDVTEPVMDTDWEMDR